ncbi:unnamed protein product [Tetraodon nigroviridis]|uniref:(spotted green pufferfish) hypothetical protein n=1 Tax=Tetraodon nigroviridis TaxID=99883 RepID=Q4SXL5_TETNG|nr:unnamed protein product [Tetraodon nigroviridis]
MDLLCLRAPQVLHSGLLRRRDSGRLHPDRHADRGASGRVQLHRGLLRRPSDPPVHHQPDLQEATPLSVTTPTVAR